MVTIVEIHAILNYKWLGNNYNTNGNNGLVQEYNYILIKFLHKLKHERSLKNKGLANKNHVEIKIIIL